MIEPTLHKVNSEKITNFVEEESVKQVPSESLIFLDSWYESFKNHKDYGHIKLAYIFSSSRDSSISDDISSRSLPNSDGKDSD